MELLGLAVQRVRGDMADGYAVEGSGPRSGGLGRWWIVEAAASISHAAMVIWGLVVASQGLGGGLEICVGSEFADPVGSSPGNAEVDLAVTLGRRPRR